jgi:transcriptional regulator with XRE-family HTH domain
MDPIEDPDLDSLGGRVAFMRALKGLTPPQLAREAHFSQNTIWMLEHNKIKEPTARLIWAVADALETTPEFLWTGESSGAEESALVAAYRKLPQEERPAILRAAGVSEPEKITVAGVVSARRQGRH